MNRILQAILVVAMSAILLAGCSRRSYTLEERADWVANKVAKELDLTAEQRTKLDGIKTDILARKDLIESLKYSDAFDEALVQLRTESIDITKLNALLAQQEAQRIELRTLLVDKAAEFHSVLTPRQREQAAEKLSRLHRHRRR